jgi:hypothetical protein
LVDEFSKLFSDWWKDDLDKLILASVEPERLIIGLRLKGLFDRLAAIEQVEVKVQKIKEEKVQNQSIDGRSALPVATSGHSFSQSTSASRSNSPFNRSPIINRSGSTDARINLSRSSFHQSENSFENSSTNPNRASPLMMRSISQSSRLSSRDKRNNFDSLLIHQRYIKIFHVQTST